MSFGLEKEQRDYEDYLKTSSFQNWTINSTAKQWDQLQKNGENPFLGCQQYALKTKVILNYKYAHYR